MPRALSNPVVGGLHRGSAVSRERPHQKVSPPVRADGDVEDVAGDLIPHLQSHRFLIPAMQNVRKPRRHPLVCSNVDPSQQRLQAQTVHGHREITLPRLHLAKHRAATDPAGLLPLDNELMEIPLLV